jgi:hypothetical protein
MPTVEVTESTLHCRSKISSGFPMPAPEAKFIRFSVLALYQSRNIETWKKMPFCELDSSFTLHSSGLRHVKSLWLETFPSILEIVRRRKT